MPDWTEIVKMRLGALGLDPERETEIIEELAAHLEDLYEGFRCQGIGEPEAFQRAAASVNDWPRLRRAIQFSESGGNAMRYRAYHALMPALIAGAFTMWFSAFFYLWKGMSYPPLLSHHIAFVAIGASIGGLGIYCSRRIRRGRLTPDQRHYIWLPGLFAAMVWWWIPDLFAWTRIGNHFATSWIVGNVQINAWFSQLIALVPVGAIAAYWSRSAGGKRKHQILAAIYPSLAVGLVILIADSWNLVAPPRGFILHQFVGVMAGVVILPGVALLLGALPCLVGSPHTPSEHGVVHLART